MGGQKTSKKPKSAQVRKQTKRAQTKQIQAASVQSSSAPFLDLLKVLLFLAIVAALIWAGYEFIVKPIGEAFNEAGKSLGSAFDTLSGEGSASDIDSRGRKYTHKWANLSQYDDPNTVAKIYYTTTDATGNTNWGTGKITGEVLNNTNKDLSYASIEFGLYNGETKYASCYDNISNLKAGSRWSFEATCLSWRSGSTYKIEDITWY